MYTAVIPTLDGATKTSVDRAKTFRFTQVRYTLPMCLKSYRFKKFKNKVQEQPWITVEAWYFVSFYFLQYFVKITMYVNVANNYKNPGPLYKIHVKRNAITASVGNTIVNLVRLTEDVKTDFDKTCINLHLLGPL